MMSSKCKYLHTNITEKGENIKMSAIRVMANLYRGRTDDRESKRKGERIGSSSVENLEGESREGTSIFTTKNPKLLDKTTVTGGRSTWLGSGEETRRASGWGRRNRVMDSVPRTEDTNDEGQQTVSKETQDRPRTRVQARARPSTPSHTQASL